MQGLEWFKVWDLACEVVGGGGVDFWFLGQGGVPLEAGPSLPYWIT